MARYMLFYLLICLFVSSFPRCRNHTLFELFVGEAVSNLVNLHLQHKVHPGNDQRPYLQEYVSVLRLLDTYATKSDPPHTFPSIARLLDYLSKICMYCHLVKKPTVKQNVPGTICFSNFNTRKKTTYALKTPRVVARPFIYGVECMATC